MSTLQGQSTFEFYSDPIAHGRITPRALLASTGTISAPLIRELLINKTQVLVTRLVGPGWFFNIGYHNGRFLVQRNNCQIAIDEKWCVKRNPPETMLVSWQPDALLLSFGNPSNHWDFPQLVCHAQLIAPPTELVKWVRSQELTPVELFDSEEQFVIRVHSALQRFDERLRPVLNRDFFWDIQRRGNKIVRRSPKREVEIQSVLHAMLVDLMQLSNIDVLPEVRSSAGAVDFLFQCGLANGKIAKLCVEFKNAHSPDLVRGLPQQLRQYMRQLEVANGAYCVLDYREENFTHPVKSTADLLAELHSADEPYSMRPSRPTKIHWFKLGGKGSTEEI